MAVSICEHAVHKQQTLHTRIAGLTYRGAPQQKQASGPPANPSPQFSLSLLCVQCFFAGINSNPSGAEP